MQLVSQQFLRWQIQSLLSMHRLGNMDSKKQSYYSKPHVHTMPSCLQRWWKRSSFKYLDIKLQTGGKTYLHRNFRCKPKTRAPSVNYVKPINTWVSHIHSIWKSTLTVSHTFLHIVLSHVHKHTHNLHVLSHIHCQV